jgi:hypothetical protein
MPPGTTSEIAVDGETAAVSGTPNGGTANVISNGSDGVNAVAEAAAANSTTELATGGALAGGECSSFSFEYHTPTVHVSIATSTAVRIAVLTCACLACPWCRRHYHRHCPTALFGAYHLTTLGSVEHVGRSDELCGAAAGPPWQLHSWLPHWRTSVAFLQTGQAGYGRPRLGRKQAKVNTCH